jgi:hypothetical protein
MTAFKDWILSEYPNESEDAYSVVRELHKSAWNAALAHAAEECDHMAFLCHTHDELGKGRERGMLDCAEALRALSIERQMEEK